MYGKVDGKLLPAKTLDRPFLPFLVSNRWALSANPNFDPPHFPYSARPLYLHQLIINNQY